MEREEGQQQAKRGKGKMMDRKRSQLPAKRNTGGNESQKKGGGGGMAEVDGKDVCK